MRRLTRLAAALCAVATGAAGQGGSVKALAGGTLIDGFGGSPLRNRVVLIDSDELRYIALRQRVHIVIRRGARTKG